MASKNPALEFLEKHDKGQTADELAAAIREVTTAALQHEKKGHVTLKIEINGDGIAAFVTASVAKKVPEADPATAIMFADRKGNLVKSMPGQLSIDSAPKHDDEDREPDTETVGDKVVDINTGEVVG